MTNSCSEQYLPTYHRHQHILPSSSHQFARNEWIRNQLLLSWSPSSSSFRHYFWLVTFSLAAKRIVACVRSLPSAALANSSKTRCVVWSSQPIQVNSRVRSNVKHIYSIGRPSPPSHPCHHCVYRVFETGRERHLHLKLALVRQSYLCVDVINAFIYRIVA